MIVKNESAVIERSLSSLKNLIDYWVIVDTGSTDQTQQIIKEFLKDIPGELHERPWINFAHNRNEALDLAGNKGDYLLLIDADERLVFSDAFAMPDLDRDFYHIEYNQDTICIRTLLINNHKKWRWEGVVHEHLIMSEDRTGAILEGVVNIAKTEGSRSKNLKMKHLNDAKILEEALKDDPVNTSYVFHLATSYEGADEKELALQNFEKRLTMGGDERQIFGSLYRIGVLQKKLGMPSSVCIQSFLKAYHYRPGRFEPLFCLANYFIDQEWYLLGYLISKFALTNPFYNDYYFTQMKIYDYGMLYQFAECAFRIKELREAYDALKQLLAVQNLPDDIRETCEKNIALPIFATNPLVK